MKTSTTLLTALALSVAVSPAFAYTLVSEKDTNGCDGDGAACYVYCDNGELAGVMYWNNGVWSDGVRWDKDKDKEARAICAANGTACT